MRAKLIAFTRESGFGRLELADGSVVPFDVTSCRTPLPELGGEVEIEMGEGRRGPVVKKVSQIATPTRELLGWLSTWGRDDATALCWSPHDEVVVRVPFEERVWRGGSMAPAHGAPVRCLVPVRSSTYEPPGWAHERATSVGPMPHASFPSNASAALRKALAEHGVPESFPGWRASQPVKPLARARSEPDWAQYEDWPRCTCGPPKPTTYLGHPPNGATFDAFVADGARYWEDGAIRASSACPLVSDPVEPEAWSDVACFACEACGARYFTFQYT